ncbi:MAG: AraC-like DNA-binding protein [Planctomycetota bacterium]|jgi:AraC-like DNA-binding protein
MKARTSRQGRALHLFLRFFLHHVESQGTSEFSLRKKLRLKEGWLESYTYPELVALVPRLIRAAESLTADDQLCMHAGQRFHFCLAGLGGLVATHAPTPALALETFGRFVGGFDLLAASTEASGEMTVLYPDVTAPWPKPIREKVVDGFLSSVVAALRAVCGSSFAPLEVHLARPRSGSSRGIERAFRAQISFGAERDALAIESTALTSPSLLYEPLLYEQLRFTADLEQEKPSGTGPMRQLVEQAIRAGGHTIESASATLMITSRTLQRRLQGEGVTFRSVLSTVRVGLAEDLLAESDMTLTEIAKRLRYSDDKGLRKAIQNVTGKSPGQIRRESKA